MCKTKKYQEMQTANESETSILEKAGVLEQVRKREKDDSGFTNVDEIAWEDEIDLKLYNEAMEKHKKIPEDISFEDMMAQLGFDDIDWDSLEADRTELAAGKSLLDKCVAVFSDTEVRGPVVDREPIIDESDGWD